MLLRRERVAEPGDVAHVGKQGGLRQLADDFLAEGVLVADVHRDPRPARDERFRPVGAALEIR